MNAIEARSEALYNEYYYILGLIEALVQKGFFKLTIPYILTEQTNTILLDLEYKVTVMVGCPGVPGNTLIEW